MPSSTGAPWNLPGPTLPEAPDGPGDIGELATSVHQALGRAYPCLSTARPAPTEGLLIYETDTDVLQVSYDGVAWTPVWRKATPTNGVTTGVLTASTNFTITTQTSWNMGGVVCCTWTMTRQTSGITSGSTGNIGNLAMATVAAGWRPPAGLWQINGGGAGGQLAAGYVDSSGVVAVGALAPGADWTVGLAITWSGIWPQGN